MLFNSQEFVFLFLPLVLLVFLWLRRRGQSAPLVGWLLLASLGFYAWWDWRYLALLLGSVAVNWWLGLRVQALYKDEDWALPKRGRCTVPSSAALVADQAWVSWMRLPPGSSMTEQRGFQS